MGSFLEEVGKRRDTILQLFQKLHEMPEKGMQEYKTSAFIKELLSKSNKFDELIQVGETGLIGIIKGEEEGPVVGIRTDIDGLEFDIDGEKVMKHACGHDANMTMTISAALIVAEQGIKKGTLKLILQPAEETLNGAKLMLDSGYMDDIDELYGMHLRPIQEAKLGQAIPALRHAASAVLYATIHGEAGHGARPHLAINAIEAGVNVVNAINAIHMNPAVSHSVKVTKFISGGTATNIIPDRCEMTFDLRAQTNEEMKGLLEKTKRAIIKGAETVGARAEIVEGGSVPAAEYDDELIKVTKKAIEKVLGFSMDELLTPGGEDFHYYSTEGKLKTAYVGLGADLTPGLHSLDMQFNTDALYNGVKIFLEIIDSRLNQ